MGSAAAPLLSSLYPHLALANTISLWGEMTQTVFGNIQHPTFSHSHRLDPSGPFNLQLSCQNVMMNFLGLGFLEMYFLWGTLQLNSISCNIIMEWMCPWQLWLGPWELSIGSWVRRFKCGGEEEYIDHNWGAGPGWRWRCGAEIGVLSHLMDYSSTWGSSSGCSWRKGEGAGVS